MSKIVLKNVNKYFGKNHVLKDLDLTIEDGEFMTLLGPSGCGKTTTLRVIAGLEEPQSGVMYIGDKEIINVTEALYKPPGERDLNLVFQSYALWPHMTVYQNVAFGLETKKVPKSETKTRVENVLKRLQIHEYIERYPAELSGGQQQRVAIARAIVTEPKILLLDEPLSNLDARLRIEMRSELKRLHQELKTTVIYVTHDQTEALTMSTRIATYFNGVLVQVDTPVNLYKNPSTLEVADFVGNPSINFIDATAELVNGKLMVNSILGNMEFSDDTFTENMPSSLAPFPCIVAVRPEQVALRIKKGMFEGTVYSSMPAGSETLVHVKVGETILLAKKLGIVDFEPNQKIWATINPNTANIYDKESGMLVKRATA